MNPEFSRVFLQMDFARDNCFLHITAIQIGVPQRHSRRLTEGTFLRYPWVDERNRFGGLAEFFNQRHDANFSVR